MCGRFYIDTYPQSIVEALIDAEMTFSPREQIFPTNEVAVAIRPLINTRSAEAWNKKTWSNAMLNGRCIIPASGFYEWDQNQAKGKRDCYKITPINQDGFAFGGLYEINQATGEMFMSVLTTAPNKEMQKIHHRMPVILASEDFDSWFDSNNRTDIDKMMLPVGEGSVSISLN